MELSFYLMSEEGPGTAWDGVILLDGDDLHIELRGTEAGEARSFDLPLREVVRADFERGLVIRKLRLKLADPALRCQFPAGIHGEDVELLVPREDACFGEGESGERDAERLADQIREVRARKERSEDGLPS